MNRDRYDKKGLSHTHCGVVELEQDQLPLQYLLDQLLEDALSDRNFKLPMLPAVVARLMELANDPNVSFEEVEKAISSDAVMAGKILAVANSAYFSRGIPITSLRSAISRLGLVQVRDIAFRVALETKVFKNPTYESFMQRERKHAIGAAMICRKVCEMVGLEQDLAFLCGLLHDVGNAVAASLLVASRKDRNEKLPAPERLMEALAPVHADYGSRIIHHWKLPLTIEMAVGLHHGYETREGPHQMALAVAVADLACRHAGIGRKRAEVEPLKHKEFFDLNLSVEQAQDVIAFAEEVASSDVLE
ncbi:MAG: HDOD domain-containing protein [Deltaproteobacteria bacterium]|nr:MAG: HDOD domain-containing protein [Deltaproteobacteria bacterium]